MAFRAGGCHHERALSAEVAWLFEGLEGAGVAGVWWWWGVRGACRMRPGRSEVGSAGPGSHAEGLRLHAGRSGEPSWDLEPGVTMSRSAFSGASSWI